LPPETGLDAPGTGLQRPAFEFVGWNTAADGSGVAVTPRTAAVDLGQTPVTLYAQWSPVAPAWQSTQAYAAGDLVYHAGRAYEAQWWTRNEPPGSSPWGAWAELGAYAQGPGTR
jgi:uncharacterized repeat protein (TIGR02543 family)